MPARLLACLVENLAEGKNAVGANQTGDLNGQRRERGQIDQSDEAQEYPAHQGIVVGIALLAPEPSGNLCSGNAMVGNEVIAALGERGETGQVSVKP